MNKLMTRLFQFFIGSFGAAFLNLILIPVTTYYLNPTEYGKTSMFFLAQTMLIYVIYLGFDQAYTREYYQSDDSAGLLLNAMLVPFVHSFFLILLMSLNAPLLSRLLFNDSQYTTAIYLLALSILFLIFERFILLNLRMRNQALAFSLYTVLIKLLILLMTILFLVFFSPTFIYAVYAALIGQIIGDILLIIFNRAIFQYKKVKVQRKLIKQLGKFGIPIAVSTFIYSLFVVIDKLFLRYSTDFYQLGLYTAAFKVASALMIIQVSFSNFWVPTAYEWFKEKKAIFYYKYVSDAVMLVLSVLFLFLLLFKDVVVAVLSPEYSSTKLIFPFLCFYPLMMTASETTTLGIVFSKKSYLNILVSLFSLVATISLNAILTPEYGAVGAAVATGTSYIVFFFLRTYFSMRVWQGFSIRKHIFVLSLLYLLAFYNIFSTNIIFYTVLVLAVLLTVLSIYFPLIKQGISLLFKMKKEKTNL